MAYNLDEWTFYYDWGSTAKDTVDTRTVEFNARYMEKSLFCLTCYPPVTGRPSRLRCLIGIVAYIQKCPDVEFMRATNYVECYWG